MSKFTEGQKVRILPGAIFARSLTFDGYYGLAGEVRTVIRPTVDVHGDITVSKNGTDRSAVLINEGSVEAVDTPTEQEKTVTKLEAGKRYRWTVEGVAVNETASRFGLQLRDERFVHNSQLMAGELELLPDPLPTTPGSVIRKDGFTLVRTVYDAPWQDVRSVARDFTNEQVEGATVLFDAGAEVKP